MVFGDIGTSPIYAFRESFTGAHLASHPMVIDRLHVFGVLSLIAWSLMLVVTVKYVMITLKADNKGEGGSFALFAFVSNTLKGQRTLLCMSLLAVLATALFYGDAMITPAISVLGAMEGLSVISPQFSKIVIPGTVVILIFLFVFQRSGTAKMGTLFGPITLIYFLTIAVLGMLGIARHPDVLFALSPHHAVQYFINDPLGGFFALGSVVLAVTGAEALYADMGHFGRKPIQWGWSAIVFPCLLINYLGQGALVLDDPKNIANPFFLLAPEWALIPLVLIATCAAIIASQAVISGAYSVTQQAMQLGFLPRMAILHTSPDASGQIYMPTVNWGLLMCVLVLVFGFGSSSKLGAAYGIAVTGTMAITTSMMIVVVLKIWRWNKRYAIPLLGVLLTLDLALFAASATKISDGGWFPLMIAGLIFIMLTTWNEGRALLRTKLRQSAMPVDVFIKSAKSSAIRTPGTAVFLTSTAEGVPHALLHNMKHNKVIHQQVVFLTVQIDNIPYVSEDQRLTYTDLGDGFVRLITRYGFMQDVNVPQALAACKRFGSHYKMMDTSFFLNRQTLIASEKPGMALWREKLFAWMMRNSATPMEFFRLPPNRVVEMGSQVEI